MKWLALGLLKCFVHPTRQAPFNQRPWFRFTCRSWAFRNPF